MGVSGWQGGSLPFEFHVEAVICSRHGTHAAYLSAHLKIKIESYNVIIKFIISYHGQCKYYLPDMILGERKKS